MKTTILEICCYSIESAQMAQNSGADRIELCAGIYEGGLTPSYASIKQCRENLHIPIHVIIRPREADFCYSDNEFYCMKENILICKKLGVDGIVSGILLPNGKIDKKRTRELIELAKPMSFTFHRAFDMVNNQEEALEDLIEIGANRVLSSGGQRNAWVGKDQLKKLVQQANGRITILPGGGINANNCLALQEYTQVKEIHCSAKKTEKSKMQYFNVNVNMGSNADTSEYDHYETNPEQIRAMIEKMELEAEEI